MLQLRNFTTARVGLGAAGVSLPTREVLAFQLAHARARDAVHAELDIPALKHELGDFITVHSEAPDRATYLRRPDLGRRLDSESRGRIAEKSGQFDVAFVIADGLSAQAVQRHAPRILELALPELKAPAWRIAPLVVAQQGRVAIGDEIGQALGADLVVVLIGERPGLSSPDSLGVYLTWQPRPGRTDAERNCISNIHADGLSYPAAVQRLVFLLTESRNRRLSGVRLREESVGQVPVLPTRQPLATPA
jgi:ethanolamine ammonia-lyase small subunit